MARKQKNLEHAVSLYESGFSIEEVAANYGVTRQAMHEALKRRGVVFRPQLRFGKDNHFYRGGGRKRTEGGYIKLLINGKWRFEHRVVMECKIGRDLRADEVVHHVNEVKDDNRPDNLEIMTPGGHTSHHRKGKSISSARKEQQRLAMQGRHINRPDISCSTVLDLFRQGMSVNQIANALGCGWQTAKRRLDQATE